MSKWSNLLINIPVAFHLETLAFHLERSRILFIYLRFSASDRSIAQKFTANRKLCLPACYFHLSSILLLAVFKTCLCVFQSTERDISMHHRDYVGMFSTAKFLVRKLESQTSHRISCSTVWTWTRADHNGYLCIHVTVLCNTDREYLKVLRLIL